MNKLPGVSFGCRFSVVFCCGAVLSAASGCGHNGRVAVEGTVTLDGRPLHEAQIEFVPRPGTAAPTVGGEIINGKFAIESEKGPLPGEYRIRITKSGPTGRKVRDIRSNAMVDEHAQILPVKYNDQTELEAEVTSGGSNSFEFALTSR